MAWHTAGLAASNVEWWRYGHDEWNTRRYGTDTRPPGITRSLVANVGPHTLTLTAPGDDWYAWTPALYRIEHSGGSLDLPATVAAGGAQTLSIPTGIDSGTVRAVDDRENLGKAAPFSFVVAPTPTPAATVAPTPSPSPGRALCPAAPAPGCRAPIAAGKAQLQLRDKSPDAKDRLQWKWLKGAATSVADFGDPTTTTSYRLCIYDGNPNLIAEASMPAGGTCNAASPRPCWRAFGRGYRYVDRDYTPDGIQQMILKSGTAGKAQIIVKGRGDALDMPPLPITTLPIRVQLVSSTGGCWEATYSTTLRNQTDQVKAKSD